MICREDLMKCWEIEDPTVVLSNADYYDTREKVKKRIAEAKEELQEEIKDLGKNLSKDIDDTNERIDELDTKVDGINESLNDRIDDLDAKVDNVGGVTKEYLDETYYNKSEVDSKISSVDGKVTSLKGDVDQNTYDISQLDKDKADKTSLDSYYTKGQVDDKLEEYQEKGNYATKEELSDVENKIPSIDGLATESYVDEAVSKVDVSEQLKEYAKTTEVDEKLEEYYTKEEVDEKLDDVEVDLSDYYSKGESDGKFALKDDVPTVQVGNTGTEKNYVYSKGEKFVSKASKNVISSAFVESYGGKTAIKFILWGDNSSGQEISMPLVNKGTNMSGDMSVEDKIKLDSIDIDNLQDKLVSGTNIKTVNGESLLGEGNINIEGGSGSVDAYTKAESDARYGTLEEQKSLRNDVEQALGEIAENESAIQGKQDKMTNNYLSKVDVGGSSISIETKAFKDESVQKTDTINFKTINGQAIFGMGDIKIEGGGGSVDAYTKAETDEKFVTKEEFTSTVGDIETLLSQI